MKTSAPVLAVLMLALAGCAGGSRPAPAPAPVRTAGVVRVPQVMAPRGLGGVIGQEADRLTRRFGEPRIDLAEGDARKLQFSGATCVLDIYLYPMSPGAEPTAAHVDARLRQGGAAADAGACIREVEAGK
ncbi:hypothetical protein [Erythrobacter sp.]|uniref:hypothetical protein n=1 Tax=Erythrobacter sp. TaxID=1042 RepID=UPI0025F79BEE|nr:hypothetical protein [Erythrobacter sp.]